MNENTFESTLEKLEASVTKLEEGKLPLEEAVATFEEGIRWSRECRQFLDQAEKRIEVILSQETGENQGS